MPPASDDGTDESNLWLFVATLAGLLLGGATGFYTLLRYLRTYHLLSDNPVLAVLTLLLLGLGVAGLGAYVGRRLVTRRRRFTDAADED